MFVEAISVWCVSYDLSWVGNSFFYFQFKRILLLPLTLKKQNLWFSVKPRHNCRKCWHLCQRLMQSVIQSQFFCAKLFSYPIKIFYKIWIFFHLNEFSSLQQAFKWVEECKFKHKPYINVFIYVIQSKV